MDLEGPRPVIVLIGGAGLMSDDEAHEIRGILDRGVLPAVVDEGAVIITGGTDSGVMRVVGELARDWPGVELLGVAPAHQVRHGSEAVEPDDDRVLLDGNHHKFILTAGETWGSETTVLLAVAKAITGESAQGLVLLANGGAVSRAEAAFFMAAGWPVLAFAGSGRAADSLSAAVRSRGGRRTRWAEALGLRRRFADEWEGLDRADVEVHQLRGDSVRLLDRRIRWRLSPDLITKAAWSRYGAYDAAANAEQAWTRRFQALLALGALLLSVAAVAYGTVAAVYGTVERVEPIKWLLVALPLALAVGSTLADTLAPSRNWLALRQAAEAVQQAIYRRQAMALAGDLNPDSTLLTRLSEVDRAVLRSGVPLAVVSEAPGRPASLLQSVDEFAEITRTAYLTERVGGQLRYYRATAQKLRRRELLTVGASAILAGAATAIATEAFAAVWIPILILAASTIVILRQRARWQDKVNLCGVAVAELDAVRTRAVSSDPASRPLMTTAELILATESILERESSDWHRTMSRSVVDAGQYKHPLVDGLP
jgi:hypothetical protein